MRIIDLLNKIANGENIPKKIKYRNDIYEYDGGFDFVRDNIEHPYFAENYCNDYEDLNSELEIIEENTKIEKLGWVDYNAKFTHKDFNREFRNIANKIDEIIDKLNEMENNNE